MSEPDAKKAKEFSVIVNGQPKDVGSKDVTFDEIVNLAYPGETGDPNKTFTVTYRKAHEPKEGSMVEGDTVEIKKEGTVFSVTSTTKS